MTLLTAVTMAVVLSGAAEADRAPLIEQALDQTMRFRIEEAPVLEAFVALTKETGVDISVLPEVIDLLPYGSDTKVSVVLENLPLREGLSQLLLPLGLTFEVTPWSVIVWAQPALWRIGRRATWDELDQLNFARRTDWAALAGDRVNLRAHVQFRVNVEDPVALLATAVGRIGAGPGDQVLTLACESLGWTWFPEADKIVILPAADEFRRELARPVSLRRTHRPLVEVLQALGQKAHLTIRHEPGVLASLPERTRQNFSLLVEGVTVGEALEQIAAATGLGYRLDGDAVVFYHPGSVAPQPAEAATAAPTASRDPYVAKLTIPAEPGKPQVEILIRASELSPDALKARTELIHQADEILRLELPHKTGE